MPLMVGVSGWLAGCSGAAGGWLANSCRIKFLKSSSEITINFISGLFFAKLDVLPPDFTP